MFGNPFNPSKAKTAFLILLFGINRIIVTGFEIAMAIALQIQHGRITIFKNYFSQISAHKIYSNNTAIGK
jgi:hypothetical protein